MKFEGKTQWILGTAFLMAGAFAGAYAVYQAGHMAVEVITFAITSW